MNELLLAESEYFNEILEKFDFINFQFIFPQIDERKKIIHFFIRFENDFYIRILKKDGLYDFGFYPNNKVPTEMSFGENRDYEKSFFDLLCVKFDDIYFDADNYFPKNFEETLTFKTYYEYRDIKNKRYYGIIPIKAIEFIKNNYLFIRKNVCPNSRN